MGVLDDIDSVIIDPEGVFKYVQIRVKAGDQEKVLVRG